MPSAAIPIVAAIISALGSQMGKKGPESPYTPPQSGGIDMNPTVKPGSGPSAMGMSPQQQLIEAGMAAQPQVESTPAASQPASDAAMPTAKDTDPWGGVNAPPTGGGEEKKGGFFGDMSTADKMAFAASIGSLLRGGMGQAPPPPSASRGGEGINMQPVFLKDLYRG